MNLALHDGGTIVVKGNFDPCRHSVVDRDVVVLVVWEVWVGIGGGWYEAAPALCCDVGGEEILVGI